MTTNISSCLNTLAKVCKGDREATTSLILLTAALGSLNEPVQADLEKVLANGCEMYLFIKRLESEKS